MVSSHCLPSYQITFSFILLTTLPLCDNFFYLSSSLSKIRGFSFVLTEPSHFSSPDFLRWAYGWPHLCLPSFPLYCKTSWLTSVKGWRKKRNFKNIKFLYLKWNLAAGEKRNVFNILTEERDYMSHPQTGKICKLMNETLSLSLLQKSYTKTPSPAWDTNLDWALCSEDRGFLPKRWDWGDTICYRGEYTVCFLSQNTFLTFLFFPFHLKWSFNLCHSSTLDCTSLILFDAGERGSSDGMWHSLYLEYYLSLQEYGEI